MSDCVICADPKNQDAKITNVSKNPVVKPGDEFSISFDIESKATLYGDTIHVSVVDRTTGACLHEDEVDLPAKSVVHQSLTGIMPDRDLEVGIALVDINTLYPDDCEAVKHLVIKKGSETKPPSDETLAWIQEHLVEIAVVLIIIIIGIYIIRTR